MDRSTEEEWDRARALDPDRSDSGEKEARDIDHELAVHERARAQER